MEAISKHTSRRGSVFGEKVLVIEDHPLTAKLLFLLLSDAGADVRLTSTAEEALELIKVFQPRLIIVDLILPKLSGLALIQKIKRDPRYQATTVIAVSSLDGVETEKLVNEVGGVAFFQKPIDPLTFVESVTHFIGGTV